MKFLFLYRGGYEKEANLSAEEAQKYMEQWMQWIGQGIEAGWLVEPGDALKPEGRVVQANRSITDGPFVESKEIVGGYSVVHADSYDIAARHAQGCPGLQMGGLVEIRELADLAQNS